MRYIFNPNESSQDLQLERIHQLTERFYEDIIGTIRESLLVLDDNLRIVDANPAFYQTFQVSPKETEGKLIYELGNGQWDIPRLKDLLDQILTEQSDFRDFEVDHHFESIGQKFMVLNARQIQREGGTNLILLAIDDDTERQRIEGKYRDTIRHLQKNNHRLVGELVSTAIAHQLNNPLGIILGYSDLVLEEALTEKVRNYLQIIRDATVRASHEVSDHLSLITASAAPTQSLMSVSILLQRLMTMVSQDLRFPNVHVSTSLAPELPGISVDPFLLLEALLNIVTNAQQACLESNGRGNITIYAFHLKERGRIRISIEDNGPGISPEHLERIFDAFFTTREATGGSGLGLSIAASLIHQYGGEIWAESQVGAGTTVHMELPIFSAVIEEEALSPEPTEREITPKRILVVNNELDFLRLLTLVLTPAGHVVDRAMDGNEAWQMVQYQKYDWILLNIMMPGMNGQQLYLLLQDYDPDQARRCIFMTGGAESPDIHEFVAGTGNPCLAKPFSSDEVRRLVSSP